jgi:DNA-binding response OmpR family regulator
MPASPRLLLVEDDRRLCGMLERLLTVEGYLVTTEHDGQAGLHRVLTEGFDVLLLDRGLPRVEGLEVLAAMRRAGVTTPVLVLSALGNPSDRVEGLDAGAEDYLAKPFDIDELLARLRAARRRSVSVVGTLQVPGGRFDPAGFVVRTDAGESVTLSARESALLEEFARHPDQVYMRGQLLARVFSNADDEGVVDTYVHYLRRKLGKSVVRTVYGIGYTLGNRS